MKLDISDDIAALAAYAIEQGDNPTAAAVQEGALWMAARLTGEPFRDLQTRLAKAKADRASPPSIPLPGMGVPAQTAMDLSTGLAHTYVDATALLAAKDAALVPPSTVAPVPVDEVLGTYDDAGDLVITRLAVEPTEADLSVPAAVGTSTLPTNGDFPRPDGATVWPPESVELAAPLAPEELAEFEANYGKPIT